MVSIEYFLSNMDGSYSLSRLSYNLDASLGLNVSCSLSSNIVHGGIATHLVRTN